MSLPESRVFGIVSYFSVLYNSLSWVFLEPDLNDAQSWFLKSQLLPLINKPTRYQQKQTLYIPKSQIRY